MYIKVKDKVVIGHPILKENIEQLYPNFSDELLISEGFYPFKQNEVKVDEMIIEDKGYVFNPNLNIVEHVFETKSLTHEQKLDQWVRPQRDYFLMVSDWTDLPNCPLSEEKKKEWQNYRNELRNITEKYKVINSPDEVKLPSAPSKK